MSLLSILNPRQNVDCESPFDQGRSAFAAGLSSDSVCPYPCGSPLSNKRTQWMEGYYGERVRRLLDRIEAKRKVDQ
jgi:hypothetical protein